MYPVSDAFKEASKRSHTIVTRAEVLDSNFQILKVLNPVQCNISVDRERDIRRTATLGLQDYDGSWTPGDAEDLLHPLANNRLRLWRGIKLPTGPEFVSQGIFDIFDAEIGDPGENLRVDIRAFDLSKSVQRARLRRNYVVPAGQRYDQAIRDLISYQAPWVSFNFPTINIYTPNLVFGASGDQAGGDPWKYASEMAASVAHDLYFDVQGVCRLEPVPSPQNDPVVWEYTEGKDGMILYVNKRLHKENTFNHVFAFGENSQFDNPVQAEAWDDDPTSPTYRYGPYGSVPTFFVSPYIATVDQAQQVADARLRQVLGATETMHMINTPMPAHEAGDVVYIKRERAKIDRTYVVEKFNINFSAQQAMNINLRELRV